MDWTLSVPNGVVLIHGLLFFSDSFINGEAHGTSFFIATFALWIIWNCLKSDLDDAEQIEISKFVAICLISNSLLGGVIQEWSSDASGMLLFVLLCYDHSIRCCLQCIFGSRWNPVFTWTSDIDAKVH